MKRKGKASQIGSYSQRLHFDGLVLQEDVVVRGRCFFGSIRRRDGLLLPASDFPSRLLFLAPRVDTIAVVR
jgi:hypothetical protein